MDGVGTLQRPWVRSYPHDLQWGAPLPHRSVTDLFDELARQWPERPFLDFLGRVQTYGEVAEEIRRIAIGMRLHGIRQGSRVGLLLPNCPYFVVALLAAVRCGATVVNFSTLLAERQLAVQLKDSGTELLITLDIERLLGRCNGVLRASSLRRVIVCSLLDCLPLRKRLLAALRVQGERIRWEEDELLLGWDRLDIEGPACPRPALEPDRDPAAILYTAGTTGEPRGAVLSHANLTVNAEQNRLWFTGSEPGEERVVAILPFFHAYGLTAVFLFAVALGAELILLPRFDPKGFLRMLRRTRPTFLAGVPTLFGALIELSGARPDDFASLKICVSGGEALPDGLRRRFQEFSGVPLTQGYGLTECSPVVACGNPPAHRDRVGSVGLPLPGTDVAIRGEDGAPVANGGIGEIWVRGPQVMLGYAAPRKETRSVLRDGWLATADLGRLDADGYLYVVDRLKDVIVSSGFKVYPHRVEAALLTHAAIAEAVVVGEADSRAGMVPVAHLTLRAGEAVDEAALRSYLGPMLSRHEMPRRFVIQPDTAAHAYGQGRAQGARVASATIM